MPNSPLALPLALWASTTVLPAQNAPGLDPRMAQIAAAYAAKVAASALFVSERTLQSVLAEELAPDQPLQAAMRSQLRLDVDRERGAVTAVLGKATATAIRTNGLGCVLLPAGAPATELRARGTTADLPKLPAAQWPRGDRLPAPDELEDIDRTALAAALDAAFREPERGPLVRTRAIVVVHRGRLVAERYAAGYTAAMPLPGWSMTKTMTNALLGIRVGQQRLSPNARLRTSPWPDDDARRALRIDDLLTMSPGLAWNEGYDDPTSDVLRMLFHSNDHAAVQFERPQTDATGTVFRYSSGVTNVLCKELRATFATDAEYWAFPSRALFEPLGMRSAVLEADASGTFVGSSYGFASARDWARLGMLYAQDGVWLGRRILPEGWVAATAQPAPASRARFGKHIWLNGDPDGDGPQLPAWADLPADLLHMDGHEGQYVIVLPRQQLVIVRLGCAKAGGFDLHGMVREVLRACTPS